MNILVSWNSLPEKEFRSIQEMTKCSLLRSTSKEQAEELAPIADVIFGFFPPSLLEKAAQCRWLQLPYAGVERVLAAKWGNPDMIVTNGSGIFGPCIAEHVLGMILSFNRGLHIARDFQHKKQWQWDIEYSFRELNQSTVGIVGFGDLGSNVAKRLQGFNARIIAFRREVRGTEQYVHSAMSIKELSSLLPSIDYLVCALPHTPATDGIINKDVFRLLPKTSFVINVGRGATIQEEDLISALSSGEIAGAGLDVTATEPLDPNSPLWEMPNVIITPHNSGMTPFHVPRAMDIFNRNWHRFSQGKEMINVVNKELGY